MGIIEELLSDTQLSDGTEVTIEYNEGEKIHLHVGRFRYHFSKSEFEEFSAAVIQGRDDLTDLKDGV